MNMVGPMVLPASDFFETGERRAVKTEKLARQ